MTVPVSLNFFTSLLMLLFVHHLFEDITDTLLSAQCVSSIGQIIKSVCVTVSQVSQSVSQSVNFRTPSISRERLKLETSNVAHILATRDPNEKMQN